VAREIGACTDDMRTERETPLRLLPGAMVLKVGRLGLGFPIHSNIMEHMMSVP